MKFILALLSLCFLCGCITIVVTNEHRSLSPSDKQLIEPLISFDKTVPGHVYVINGEQLKSEMKNHPKSLVYLFSNGCKGPNCKPLSTYTHYARVNGYNLYLVMNSYYDVSKTLKQQVEVPLYSIDDQYYDTKYTSKYVRLFQNEITGKPKEFKDKDYKGNLYFFSFERLDTIMRELPAGSILQ